MVHVEKKKTSGGLVADINAGNSTDCVYLSISDYAADEFITNAINADSSTGCAEDSAGGLIAAINDGDSTDSADI